MSESGNFGKAVVLIALVAAQDADLSGLPVIATVYECNGPEGRVLSDKPCANDAQVRQVREPNRLDGAPAAQSVPK